MKRNIRASFSLFGFAMLLCLLAFSACQSPATSSLPPPAPELSPREHYLEALEFSGLGQTALVRAWKAAAERAMTDSIEISPPFREVIYSSPENPDVTAYRLKLKGGELLEICLESDPLSSLLFVELFKEEPSGLDKSYQPMLLAEPGHTDSIAFEVQETATYLLRIQAELLLRAKHQLTIRTQAVYGSFPVSGKDRAAIWSFFGDPRDGGKRQHKGVDIFARRGTPVVAAVEGVISRVRNRGLGGKQVWLRDTKRNQSLYYAHLDSQLVAEGQRVKAGDTLGLIGNTGNARNTRPHLHFGIYRRGRGALDPYPFIARQSGKTPKIKADTSRFGKMARVRTPAARLRIAPSLQAAVLGQLDRHLPLRLLAANNNWFRVMSPEGQTGYLLSHQIAQP